MSWTSYRPLLGLKETEVAIKHCKDHFEKQLGQELNLTRVSAPLFVFPDTGLNDTLNGTERPVEFDIKAMPWKKAEIVHSLAKRKRMALYRYWFAIGEWLYTDMNAIRRDEDLDALHSLYVDQRDRELIIGKEERTMEKLQATVKKIYAALKKTEAYICSLFPVIKPTLPSDIYFITTQDLEDRYPTLSPKEREDAICKECWAVFLMQIGDVMKSWIPHDGRAPDYDDRKLNGDILIYYPEMDRTLELSSMGIRVDEDTLLKQLEKRWCSERKELPYHKMILQKELPYTIGWGLGQSRICMFLLKKMHIGEVQSSLWPEDMIAEYKDKDIVLL